MLRKIASSFFGMKFGERHSGEVGRDAADRGVYIICIHTEETCSHSDVLVQSTKPVIFSGE